MVVVRVKCERSACEEGSALGRTDPGRLVVEGCAA